jgi:hypothetical protein
MRGASGVKLFIKPMVIILLIIICVIIVGSIVLPRLNQNTDIDFEHGTLRAYMQGRAEGYLEGMLSCGHLDDKILDSVKIILNGESITIPIQDPCFRIFYHTRIDSVGGK